MLRGPAGLKLHLLFRMSLIVELFAAYLGKHTPDVFLRSGNMVVSLEFSLLLADRRFLQIGLSSSSVACRLLIAGAYGYKQLLCFISFLHSKQQDCVLFPRNSAT